jgi:hypothetical protein
MKKIISISDINDHYHKQGSNYIDFEDEDEQNPNIEKYIDVNR